MLSNLGDQDTSDVVCRRTVALPKLAPIDQAIDSGISSIRSICLRHMVYNVYTDPWQCANLTSCYLWIAGSHRVRSFAQTPETSHKLQHAATVRAKA
jgi:hypothetical protein